LKACTNAVEHCFWLELAAERLVVDYDSWILFLRPELLEIQNLIVNYLVLQLYAHILLRLVKLGREQCGLEAIRLAFHCGFPIDSNFGVCILTAFEVYGPITLFVHDVLVIPPNVPRFRVRIVLFVNAERSQVF
jgi:hypothetical protein